MFVKLKKKISKKNNYQWEQKYNNVFKVELSCYLEIKYRSVAYKTYRMII